MSADYIYHPNADNGGEKAWTRSAACCVQASPALLAAAAQLFAIGFASLFISSFYRRRSLLEKNENEKQDLCAEIAAEISWHLIAVPFNSTSRATATWKIWFVRYALTLKGVWI